MKIFPLFQTFRVYSIFPTKNNKSKTNLIGRPFTPKFFVGKRIKPP
jgi:hypothetical protein